MLATTEVLNAERLVLDANHSMYNETMVLEFKVLNLGDGEITVSHGDTGTGMLVYASSAIKLTEDKIYALSNLRGAEPTTYLNIAHGLDVSGNVEITVKTTYDKAVVMVKTENGEFVSNEFTWLGRNGEIFAETKGVSISNVKFSWDCPDYTKDIWFMGDSMFDSSGLIIPKAWPYFAIEAGYTDACWFGFGGRKSAQALEDFQNALKYDTPEYAVWCMGANDKDSATAVNTTWKAVTDEFLRICEENEITPILATIPNSRNRINYHKNQIVKNSGFRYIDLSAAVGAQDAPATSDWTSGYRHTDGIHPTELGAQAMFEQIVKDFPEIIGN